MLTDRMDTVSSPSLTGMPRAPSADVDKIGILLGQEEEMLLHVKELQGLHEEHKHNIDYVAGKLEPDERLIVQMRYLDGATPTETTTALYGRFEDFDVNFSVYHRKMYREKKRAINGIVRLAERNPTLLDHMMSFCEKLLYA